MPRTSGSAPRGGNLPYIGKHCTRRPNGDSVSLTVVALTPDFDSYPIDFTLTDSLVGPSCVAVVWSDGRHSRFHHIWLRDNCPCERCVHQVTKEQTFELVTVAASTKA